MRASSARALLEWKKAQGVPIRRMAVEGVPFAEIVRLARPERSDLVVLGSWGGETGNVEGIFFDSTAELVIKQASCPMLTIRSQKFSSGHCRVVPLTMTES